jgi:hypothetical protein
MKSITIHGIDNPLAELIKSKAQSQGLSVNKTVKKILEEALGVKPQTVAKRRVDFEEFSGVWSELELAEFQEKTKDFSSVNLEDWE